MIFSRTLRIESLLFPTAIVGSLSLHGLLAWAMVLPISDELAALPTQVGKTSVRLTPSVASVAQREEKKKEEPKLEVKPEPKEEPKPELVPEPKPEPKPPQQANDRPDRDIEPIRRSVFEERTEIVLKERVERPSFEPRPPEPPPIRTAFLEREIRHAPHRVEPLLTPETKLASLESVGSQASEERQGASDELPVAHPVNPSPRFPTTALADGASGIVMLRLRIDETGRVTSVTLYESSGRDDFDREAIETISRWRFHPRRLRGVATACHVLKPVEFYNPRR